MKQNKSDLKCFIWGGDERIIEKCYSWVYFFRDWSFCICRKDSF